MAQKTLRFEAGDTATAIQMLWRARGVLSADSELSDYHISTCGTVHTFTFLEPERVHVVEVKKPQWTTEPTSEVAASGND